MITAILDRLGRSEAAAVPGTKVDDRALDQLFRTARTHNGWQAREVPDALLEQAVDLMKMGPLDGLIEVTAIG